MAKSMTPERIKKEYMVACWAFSTLNGFWLKLSGSQKTCQFFSSSGVNSRKHSTKPAKMVNNKRRHGSIGKRGEHGKGMKERCWYPFNHLSSVELNSFAISTSLQFPVIEVSDNTHYGPECAIQANEDSGHPVTRERSHCPYYRIINIKNKTANGIIYTCTGTYKDTFPPTIYIP